MACCSRLCPFGCKVAHLERKSKSVSTYLTSEGKRVKFHPLCVQVSMDGVVCGHYCKLGGIPDKMVQILGYRFGLKCVIGWKMLCR